MSGEIMERNTVERTMKTEIDTRTEFEKSSGQARLVYVFEINQRERERERQAEEKKKTVFLFLPYFLGSSSKETIVSLSGSK